MASFNSCACVVPRLPQEQHLFLPWELLCLSDQARLLVHIWEQALAAVAVLAPLLFLLHAVFELRFCQGFMVSSFVYWDSLSSFYHCKTQEASQPSCQALAEGIFLVII